MRKLQWFLLTISLLIVSSCSKKESEVLQVTSPLPNGVVARDAPIIISFSKAIVKAESTNQWTSTPYITFTPEIPGKFTWRDTSTLIFSPDGLLPGDTKFGAALNSELLTRLAAVKGFKGDESFSFSTQSFMLIKTEFFYDRIGQSRTVGIKANLEFTYAVSPSEVLKYLKLTIDHQPHEAKSVTTQNSAIIPVEIGTATQLEKEKEISIMFDEGLVSSETNTHIKIEKPFVYKLPGLEEVKIYGHGFGLDASNGWITFRTSQEIDLPSAKSYIVLDPAKEYTLEGGREQFTIKGKFEPGSRIHFVIKKGLESTLGAKSQNDYEGDVLVGNIKPSFRFSSTSGSYLLLNGRKQIEIKTLNLSRLAVRVSQIFQNNLVFFLNAGRSYGGYEYDEEGDEGGGASMSMYRYTVGGYGHQLMYDTIPVNAILNKEIATPFDLAPYLNSGYKGFYLIEIADPAQAWRTTSKLISVSNLGLIVKQSADEVMVFATSLETNQPVAGATVNLVSFNNQTISSLKTNSDGVARFSGYRQLKKDFELKLITAELETDFNFINLADYRVETSRFEVDGKRDAQNVYDAIMYGDRTIYRPGEKIYVSGILRNLNNPMPSQLPVRLKISNPRGTVVSETQHTLNEEGSFETSYQTLSTSQTGSYRFELFTGNNLYLTDYVVSVEDFVPDRLKVNLKPSAEHAKPGDQITYELRAVNFFGPPAADRNYEFEGTFNIIPYVSKAFPEFRFTDEAAKNYSANPEVYNGKTDNDGKATIMFTVPDDVTSQGLLRARGRVAVFDESGRPVYQIAQTTIYPKEYYIGLRNLGQYYSSPQTPQKLQIIAVNASDQPIPGFKARIDLIRLEWQSVLRQSGSTGTLRYISERREIPVGYETLTLLDKPYDYTYSVPRSGEYIIRVSKEGDEGYNQIYFYAYDWTSAEITSFPVNAEAHVEMVFDKEKYAPGDRARILFEAPFNGKMLVTIERNQVFTYRYVDVVNNAASIEIPVEERFLPNAYVSCVLFRKVKEMDIPLLAGHGFKPLLVEKASNKFEVTIKAPEKIRPKTKQSVTVSIPGAKHAYLTLAAVDEGILQLKNYRTPDPYGYFYQKKALETETFDFFKHLLPEKSSSGGSEGATAKRVNPLGVQRFKPVALWSGIRTTNDNGEAEILLDVPEFNGELRLMAFVYKGDRFGSAERPMKVADPIVITPALPRFASANDTISMTLTAFNTTDKPAKLDFDIATTGGIVAVNKTPSLELGANQEHYVNVTLRTTNQIGKATVNVKTSAFGETFTSTTDLPVRPISPYTSDAITGVVDGGGTASLDVQDVYLSYNRKSYLTMSPYPVANFAKELKYLIGYPHGCIEQTVSKAFPQIYLRDIATMLDPSILNSGSPTYFVNEAITKITAMQLPGGSFSYWPNGGAANDWASVYATHFLLEAKKAGYAVPENTLKSALNAVAQVARTRKTVDQYWYAIGQKTTIKRIADKGMIYALYVVALGGAPDKNVMNYFRTERSLLTNDTQYLLAGAFALSGDRKSFLELLPPEFITEDIKRQSGECFDSPIRANALILNVLLDTDLDSPHIPRYMEYLSKSYRSYYWYSTQDNAFTLLAFGKAARMASAAKLEGTVQVGASSYAYAGGNQKFDIDPFGKKVTISMRGTGRVYYSLVTEGIRTDGKVRIEDKNIQIRREFLNRNGGTVNLNAVKQNDLIIVKLTLNSSVNHIENVAISDLLPAGFEIENPRITENTNYQFINNASSPEYMDVRDDRINLYANLSGRQEIFYYMVRAVTPGTFTYAPVVAEAMYDANYYSASGQMKLKVNR